MGHLPNQNKKDRQRRDLAPVPPSPRYDNSTVATIGDLLDSIGPNWTWAYCIDMTCGHRVAIPLAPFAIRWGLDASTDLIRRNLICSHCGHKGAQIIRPSYNGLGGTDQFPAGMAWSLRDTMAAMCNLYSQKSAKSEIISLVRALRDDVGNLEPQSAIFPDVVAPIVRTAPDGVRELVRARWGLPVPEPALGQKKRPGYQTNIRQPRWKEWRPYMEAAHRCLVPVTSFSEYDHRTAPPTVTWFARDDSRPLMFFAGVWRAWSGRRGTKANPAEGEHLLYSFLTTAPNGVVGPIHPKAMPVLLLNEADRETWLTGSVDSALALQRPAQDSAVRIVAAGSKEDTGTV